MDQACVHGPYTYMEAVKTFTNPPHYIQPKICKKCGKKLIIDLDTKAEIPQSIGEDGIIDIHIANGIIHRDFAK